MNDISDAPSSATSTGEHASRRAFLGSVSAATAAAAASGAIVATANEDEKGPAAESLLNLLPTIQLGEHRVTKLILGGNPIYGHSHFNHLYSQHLRDYHTPERVVELLTACGKAGVNTWQNSYAERTVADVRQCREAGLPFHWLLLGKPDWLERPAIIDEAAALGPIGVAPHGSSCERLHREGRLRVLRDLLKRIRQTGVLVGMSAHNPEAITVAEEEGWDVDYYMVCLYYHNRPAEDFTKLLGEAPMGEVYLPSDREKALKVIRAASKPCLAYKALAAGRADLSPSGVRDAFKTAIAGMKDSDALIVGMFQEFGDQVEMNAKLVRELCAK
jgi:hypothetical protein